MMEILFSDSACGSLKAAQHYGEGKYQDEGIGVFISHTDGSKPTKEEIETAQRETNKKLHLAWDSAVPMGGNPADIYGFSLMLSIGDISENQPGIKRKQALNHLYSVHSSNEGHQAAQEIFQEAMIVGRVLGKYQLGIGDSWIAFRIEKMIHDGKLEAVTAADKDMPIYYRVLKKRL